MAPYDPEGDLGEAQPAQKMQFSSTVDNLHPLAWDGAGLFPSIPHKPCADTRVKVRQKLSCKPFLMGIPTLWEGADTSQLGAQQL